MARTKGGFDLFKAASHDAWRIRFLYGDIKAGMILLSWNTFLYSFLCFVKVRSDHNEVLVRINLSFKPISIDVEVGRLRLVSFFSGGRWCMVTSRQG
jgi:hypothetical protein